jgi:hypothetical protein
MVRPGIGQAGGRETLVLTAIPEGSKLHTNAKMVNSRLNEIGNEQPQNSFLSLSPQNRIDVWV